MQKAEKKEAPAVYKERNTQILLSKLLNGDIKAVEPVFDPRVGYRYPVVDAIVGDASQTETFLNRLYDAGLLEKKLYDKIIFCPKCTSADISYHYCCPFCKSFDIQKSALIEHVKCGYMDVEANFKAGEQLICPKCHEELKRIDIDYRKAGVWCTCKEYGKSFDIPVPEHFCRNCHANSTFEEAIIKDVYVYTLNESVKAESSLSMFLAAAIRDFLEEYGLTVESPAVLKGKSGAQHSFDIVAYKGDKSKGIVVLDLATSTESAVSEQSVIALFAKMSQCCAQEGVLDCNSETQRERKENGKTVQHQCC